MMSPLEYLFVMIMKTKHPDADAMGKVEPSSGQATANPDPLMVRRDGQVEMRTILMEPRDHASEKLEAPLRINAVWEPLFKIGTPIQVKMDQGGKLYKARVTRIETVRDETGESMQAIAELNAGDALLQPGLTATAMLETAPLNN